jgi:hypothetical protein
LMAEWFRRQHPQRAQKIVGDPWKEIGLSSPRTELIPARLFTLLGQVCQMHGAGFDAVMKSLPFRETGMANDDCHPRFVACMLRLGDLLDLDDNRFCPVMMRMAGDNRPALSKAHEHKHTSLRHFRLDRERIEITAECADVDGYLEQWRWLDWLKQELQCQMSAWQDIAPSREFGLLPTLGKIEVRISGKHLLLSEGKRPQFGLDHDKVMELFRGANLYKREDSLRELLQNAVDATLIRIWTEHGKTPALQDAWTNPEHPEVKRLFAQYAVKVRLERLPAKTTDSDGPVKWQVTITDQGTGIRREDLPYMLSVGGSAKNLRRRALIDGMPEWMKPSGTFGIGFQSAFLWADIVTVRTSSRNGEGHHLTLHSPTGPKAGLVTIEKIDQSASMQQGTALQFSFETPKIPGRFSVDYGARAVVAIWKSFDPVLDEELPLDAANVFQAVSNFAASALIDVAIQSDLSPATKSLQLETTVSSEKFLKKCSTYFSAKFNSNERSTRLSSIFYRGQLVEKSSIGSYPFFSFHLNICAGNAAKWLTFNRNSINSDSIDAVHELIETALCEWLNEVGLDNLHSEQKPALSAALHCLGGKDKATSEAINTLRQPIADLWKDIDVRSGSMVTDLVKLASILVAGQTFAEDNRDPQRADATFSVQHTITFLFGPLLSLVAQDWQKISHNHLYFDKDSNDIDMFRLEVTAAPRLYSRERLKQAISKLEMGRHTIAISAFCELKDFHPLGLKLPLTSRTRPVFSEFSYYSLSMVMLPYFFKSGDGLYWEQKSASIHRLDEFVKWVHPRLAVARPITEVRALYEKMIQFIDHDLMKDDAKWQAARELGDKA